MHKYPKRFLAALTALTLVAALSGCGISLQYQGEPEASPSAATASAAPSSPGDVSSPYPSETVIIGSSEAPSSSPTAGASSPGGSAPPEQSPPPSSAELVPYTGVVEHLFYHPVVAYPELAFDGDNKEKGIDGYMVTVSEYNKMLQSIYDNDYILVNMNDVWSEQTDASGATKMVKNTLMIPEGKKPLILSFDDVCYYNYMLENGFTYKLVIKDGELWSYGLDPNGNPIYSQDLDAITILDKFVRQHPDFSLNGVKGCLCLTGYEGILGYRTMTDVNNQTPEAEAARQNEIKAVRPIIAILKATGWYFGSHCWGHINLSTSTLEAVQRDTERWRDEVGTLVGPTKLMFYPYGARPDGDDVQKTGAIFTYLQSQGFRIFASVGIDAFSRIKSSITAVICDRMHADGDTLRSQRNRYLKFYDAQLVFDADVRPDYGVKW
jgi:peptidoglycan/xylan/chitin deacetylase (PgdA/CDA1 family)